MSDATLALSARVNVDEILGSSGTSAVLLTLIHRRAWKGNSAKFISTILHIRVYEGGDMRLCPTPMDRMLPQDVVGLDGYAPRCIEAHRVDLHQRRGLHHFPRIALESGPHPLLAAL